MPVGTALPTGPDSVSAQRVVEAGSTALQVASAIEPVDQDSPQYTKLQVPIAFG